MITHKSIGYNGRLGNQMFQYAVLRALSLEKGYEMVLTKEKKDKVSTYKTVFNEQGFVGWENPLELITDIDYFF